MHRRSSELGKVVRSVNLTGDAICVDFFQRPDGSFGFEEYRRDMEDARGWFPIGFYCGNVFSSLEEAQSAAVHAVAWLASEI